MKAYLAYVHHSSSLQIAISCQIQTRLYCIYGKPTVRPIHTHALLLTGTILTSPVSLLNCTAILLALSTSSACPPPSHPSPTLCVIRTPSLRNWSISLGKFRAYLGAPLSPNRLLRLDKDGRVNVCIRSRFITRNFLLARKSGFFFQHLRIFLRSEADS